MTPNELKTALNTPNEGILSESISLFQRNLSTESSSWIRKVESKAKQLKTGKVVLIAILKKD